MPFSLLPPRVQRLLDRFPPTGKEKTWYPNGADERSLLLWQFFQSHPDEALPLRFANGLEYVMNNIAIAIHEDELIVGEVGLEDIAATHPEDLARAWDFWGQRSEAFNRGFAWFAAEEQAGAHGLSWKWSSRDGHAIPAFDTLLSQGLNGLRMRAIQAAAQVDPNEAERPVFWQALDTALGALSAYIRRYARRAQEMAEMEPRASRRDELAGIAARCEWLAEHAPRTFTEALQLVWFAHLGIKLDDGGVGHSFGRFDQYLLPYLRVDLVSNRLDLDQTRELVALFWIKLNRESDDIAHLSLGGQTPTGEDGVNELSFICLEVERWISRKQPNLSTRVHSRNTTDYWRAIGETIRCGAGHPAIFNDDVIVPGLLDYGFPMPVVLDYAQVGCVETFFPGLAAPWTDCYLNLAKCLELALTNGRDMLSGLQIGPKTGDPRLIASFEALFQAFENQVEAALRQMLAAKDEYDERISRHAPEPLNSAFIHNCLESGMDASGGGARYLLTGAYGVGLGTAADSLAAVRELVFEQGRVTLEGLVSALKANFAGFESLRQFCLNRAPKYGNDDERADAIAVRIVESFGRQTKRYSDDAWQAVYDRTPQAARRAYHYAMFGSVLSHTGMGACTAASANGRLAGQTLSDGGSPSQGCNRHGATATLRSLSKADYRLAPGGAALNLRLSPGHFAGEAGLDLLTSLLETYFKMGGEQIQVNMVSVKTLRRAQEDPEAFHDLVVRVAGFTAYFVSLSPELQQEILARAEGC
jgi:pyruvate formate-lyase/glycerol dehydratase family glycyl radical enzyme